MASNLKVDIVKPTATNGSLSLKGDSGGSATTNGISVDSSGDTSITGTTTIDSLDVSAGTLTLANDQISGDKIEGGTIGSVAITTADINGGTIDGTTIGGTTPAAGSFTSVDATSASLDGAVTINDSGADVDFRVESDTNENALFVEGSSGNVGINENNPSKQLQIYKEGGNNLEIQSVVRNANGGTGVAAIGFNVAAPTEGDYTQAGIGLLRSNPNGGGSLVFYNAGTSATTSDFTTAHEKMRIDSIGNLKFDSGYGSVAIAYGCRAWVNFDGTFGTSPFTIANGGIRASGNVSSITDNGTGDYTVTFATNMPDTNYGYSVNGGGGSTHALGNTEDNGTSTGSIIVVFRRNDNNNLVDATEASVAIFR